MSGQTPQWQCSKSDCQRWAFWLLTPANESSLARGVWRVCPDHLLWGVVTYRHAHGMAKYPFVERLYVPEM